MNDLITHTGTIRLGPRLQTIASLVPPGASLGDIGTDHAYLPVYLVQKGIISKAIGVEIHKGPYEAARQTVKIFGLNGIIKIYLGNGLAPLTQGEVDTLTIAGMGGVTILDILGSNLSVLEGVSTLILQPQGAEARVRKELLSQGWKMRDECLVEEDSRVYTVIFFSRINGMGEKNVLEKVEELTTKFQETNLNTENREIDTNSLRKIIWQLGPLILAKKEKLLKNVLNDLLVNQQNIIREMSRTERKDIKIQADGLRKEIMIMEGIRIWLFQ
jgi:tRNA (adenine22-N1)-methyltransferase